MPSHASDTLRTKYIRLLFIAMSVVAALLFLELTIPQVLTHIGLSSISKPSLIYELTHVRFSSDQSTQGKIDPTLLYGIENLSWLDDYVVHPYLGFVMDPTKDSGYNVFGFLGDGPIFTKESNTVVIGVFGGSVAWFLYRDGKDELVKQFSSIPQYQGKTIKIVSVALGAYKQPQQLLALNYFLSLGAHFDVIINLDGFNEAAVPYADNFSSHITPYFPHYWNIHSRQTVSLPTLQVMIRTTITEQQRYVLSQLMQKTLLRHSEIALLIWHVIDQGLKNQLYTLNTQLTNILSKQPETYQVTGPAPTKNNLEVLDESLAIWQESSLQMARVAVSNDIRYYHALQPNQYLPGSKPMGLEEQKIAIVLQVPDDTSTKSFYRYKEGVEALYPRMREAGAREAGDHGIAFLDLTQLFHDTTEPIYADSCCHYNKKGTDMVIGELSRRIAHDLAAHPTQKIY